MLLIRGADVKVVGEKVFWSVNPRTDESSHNDLWSIYYYNQGSLLKYKISSDDIKTMGAKYVNALCTGLYILKIKNRIKRFIKE
ncbi:hypothetical protein [Flavobacterium sp. UGB4466]|uniref:hypothetical protein n=1 Tax=Flavobacterium sp. UGB4466 TaxID=2730889 RepID=UPI00192C2014|nr:hypothetical protein [Flavobacterium sp. UGB4466]